jgi:hypothetical protein
VTQTIEITLDPASAAATIAKAEKLCARASSKGLSGGWKVVGVQTVKRRDEFNPLIEYIVDVLTIEGTPFAYNGWNFVAGIEWIEGKPFVGVLPGYEGAAIDREALKVNWCDHCRSTRKRNKVYIVESADAGRKQVGSTCLRDFLGHDIRATYFLGLSEIEDELSGGSGWTPSKASTLTALAVGVAAIEALGWVPTSQQETKTPTRTTVSDYLFANGTTGAEARKAVGLVTEAHTLKAATVLHWITTEFAGSGDYAENLRVAASLSETDYRTLGVLVSGIAAYDKAQAAAAARIEEGSTLTEARYAEDGQRITVEVEVTSVRHFQSDYGTFAYITFKSGTHRFKWKATGYQLPETGQHLTLTGTVKGVDEYQGAVFTVLTRCKFTVKEAA